MLQTGNCHVMKPDNAIQGTKGREQRGSSQYFLTVNESILCLLIHFFMLLLVGVMAVPDTPKR